MGIHTAKKEKNVKFAVGGLFKNANNFVRGTAMIGAGGLAGGVGSMIAGGNFWDGTRNGLISAGLNHFAHMVQQKITINSMFRKANIDPNGQPIYSKEYALSLVDKMDYLNEWHNKGNNPNIKFVNYGGFEGEYVRYSHTVLLDGIWNTTNYRLVSTMFHEFYHAYQYERRIVSAITKQYGPISKYSQSKAILEAQAYSFQMYLGDMSVQNRFNKYYNRFTKFF